MVGWMVGWMEIGEPPYYLLVTVRYAVLTAARVAGRLLTCVIHYAVFVGEALGRLRRARRGGAERGGGGASPRTGAQAQQR